MLEARLPAHLEVSALLRLVQANGGFGAIIQKGERESGTVMVLLCEHGKNTRAYERMPQLDGKRSWVRTKFESADKAGFDAYVARRGQQDRDMWIVELDIAQGERLIGLGPDYA